MAATIASRRGPVLLFSTSGAVAPVSAAGRPFNAYAQMCDSDDEKSSDFDSRSDAAPDSRRRRVGGFLYSDAFSGPTRSLSQMLNMIEQEADTPRRGCAARVDNDALYVRIDMPGLGKEHVRVSADRSTLTVKGEGEPEPEGHREGGPRKYSRRIGLPAELFKMDQIRAEMKNGVLKLFVPMVKEEERKDVFQVQIE